MADEEDSNLCKVEYLDDSLEVIEETNWIKHQGRCRVTYPNGDIFEGKGLYIFMGATSGEDDTLIEKGRYDGNYVDGMRQGYGEMTYPNGDQYTGEWVSNKFEGEGSYVYKNSDIYSGSWVKGKKHGKGIYLFSSDDSKFNGLWEKGLFKSGVWEMSKGVKYIGEFKGGRPFGPGTFEFASGLKQTGSYIAPKDEDSVEENITESEVENTASKIEAEDSEDVNESNESSEQNNDTPVPQEELDVIEIPPNVTWQGNPVVTF